MLRMLLVSMAMCGMLAGCGGTNDHLEGKVSFEDGTPLNLGSVCFLREGFLARGEIQSDGSYVVGSLESDDGLPPGTYQVYIDGAEVENPRSPSGVSAVIAKELTSPQTSGLSVTIPHEGRTFDIKVSEPK